MTILSAPETSKITLGVDKIISMAVKEVSEVKNSMDACYDSTGVPMTVTSDLVWKTIKIAMKRGVKARVVTNITKDNIIYCKEMMENGVQLRHSDGAKGNFVIDDKTECTIFMVIHEGETPAQAITTNVKSFVSQQQILFETLWSIAVPLEQKINEIEEGAKQDFVRYIFEPVELQQLVFELIKSAKEEILLLFSTANAFYRQEREGLVRLIQETVSKTRTDIRILTNTNDRINDLLLELKSSCKLKVIELQTFLQTKVWTLVVDKKLSLEVEIKDDTKGDSHEAMGFAKYSNSQSVVWAHVSIFETLWIQSELAISQNHK